MAVPCQKRAVRPGFGLDGGDGPAGQGQVLDHDGGPPGPLVLLRVPDGLDPPVDQHRPLVGAGRGREAAVLVGTEAGAVGVREQHVVVLGEEAHGGREVGVGPRGVGQIEQLPAAPVAEGPQAGARAAPGPPAARSASTTSTRRRPRPARRRRGSGRRSRRWTEPGPVGARPRCRPASTGPGPSVPRPLAGAPGRGAAGSGRRRRGPRRGDRGTGWQGRPGAWPRRVVPPPGVCGRRPSPARARRRPGGARTRDAGRARRRGPAARADAGRGRHPP